MSEESTTPDLVERWQEASDAYARRDFQTMGRFVAPDVVWDISSAGFGIFEGAAAVRSFLEDWLGAYEEYDMDALFTFYDPEIVWDQTRVNPTELAVEYHGHAGVRQFFRAWLEPFESFRAHPQELIDAGGQAVVVRARQGGRGKQSGVEVEMPSFWQVYRLENRLIVRIDVYDSESDALEAVGLEE